jgi:hypothetical protein
MVANATEKEGEINALLFHFLNFFVFPNKKVSIHHPFFSYQNFIFDAFFSLKVSFSQSVKSNFKFKVMLSLRQQVR